MPNLYLVKGKFDLVDPRQGHEFDVNSFNEHCVADSPDEAIELVFKQREGMFGSRPVLKEKWKASRVEVSGYEIEIKKKEDVPKTA